jgi:predicted class III extradiol MEMO1 family dioxygenase
VQQQERQETKDRKSHMTEGSLEVKLPTIGTDEKQSREEA